LYLIWAYYAYDSRRGLAIALCIATALIVAYTTFFFRRASSNNPLRLNVAAIDPRDREVVAYTVTYIVPLLVTPSDDPRRWVGVLVFFVVTGILQIRLNIVYTNPVLALMGLFSYEVKTTQGATHFLLSRRRTLSASVLYAAAIGDGVFTEVENGGGVTVPTH